MNSDSTTLPGAFAFPIDLLPTEILVKVLFFLDGYTLNSVLEAFPEISHRCILITDRPQTALFVGPHLRRVQLRDLASINPSRFIKLYEVEDADGSLVNTYGTDDLRQTPFYKSLNAFSFVHFATPHSGMPKVCHLIHEVFLSGATAEISHCPAGTIITADSGQLCSDDETSLILKGFNHVEYFKAPENLESLTVVFGNDCGDETPSLHDIDFRLAPRHLKIVYYDRFPEIYDIHLNTLRKPKRTGSVIELVHAPSMKTHIEGPLPRKPGYNSISYRTARLFKGTSRLDYNIIDSVVPKNFCLNFHRINLIGCPYKLVGTYLVDPRSLVMVPRGDYKLAFLHIKWTNERDPGTWYGIGEGIPCTPPFLRLLSYESSFLSTPPFKFHKKRGRQRFQDCPEIFTSIVYHTTCWKYSVIGPEDVAQSLHYSLTHHCRSSEKALHFRDLDKRITPPSSSGMESTPDKPDLINCIRKDLSKMMGKKGSETPTSCFSVVGFGRAGSARS